MADDRRRKGPEDPTKINVNEAYEIGWWTSELGVSEEVLKTAVKAVGVMVKDVKSWLRERCKID